MRAARSRSLSWALLVVCCLSLRSPDPLRAASASVATTFHLAWAWSVTGGGLGEKGLEVVDFYGDGRPEILVGSQHQAADGYWYLLEQQDGMLIQTFSSLPRADGLVGVAAGVEAGKRRIVAAGRSSLNVYDGVTRFEIASFPTSYAIDKLLAVGDVDGDGTLDAVLCDETDLRVYELLLGTVRTKDGFGCRDLAVGQVDTDPQLEIALSAYPTGGYVLDGASLAIDWTAPSDIGGHLVLSDFDADGRDEVASLVSGGGVRVQDPESGSTLWEASELSASVLAASNVDGEAGSELLWAGLYWGSIHILDGPTPVELSTISGLEEGARTLAVGDTDADGVANILWSTVHGSTHLQVARSDSGKVEARTEDWSGPFFGMGVGDFEGSGQLEVATASHQRESGYTGGAPFALSFRTGRLERFAPPDWGGQVSNYLLGFQSAQLDSDAQLEFCTMGGRNTGCFDGSDFGEMWQLPANGTQESIAIGELDDNAFPEILVASGFAIVHAFEGESGWLKWRTPPIDPWYPGIYRLAVLDILGDSRPEVLASTARGPAGRIWAFDSISGLIVAGPWTADVQSMGPAPMMLAPGELLVGRSTGEILPFDLSTGTFGAALAIFPGPVTAFGFADFDRDGTPDPAALLDDHFEIQSGETGSNLYVGPFLSSYGVEADSFLVGDFDGNTVPEILVGTSSGIAMFRAPLFALFSDGFESGDTSNW